MTTHDVIAALRLPEAARIDVRVAKALLLENAAATAADRRLIRDGVAALRWAAVLKPATIGIAEHRDDEREVGEIQLLVLTPAAGAAAGALAHLAERIHRAIPYPLLLLAETPSGPLLTLCHKRRDRGNAAGTPGAAVLDGPIVTARLGVGAAEGPGDAAPPAERGRDDREGMVDPDGVAGPDETGDPGTTIERAFLEALALERAPRASLLALYEWWIDAVHALDAARITGAFAMPTGPQRAAARREALQRHAECTARITRLQKAAARERQMARRVELNAQLAAARTELKRAAADL